MCRNGRLHTIRQQQYAEENRDLTRCDMTGRYELKNKGVRLEKVNDDNFIDLMELEVAKSQKDYVASNTVSMAQAYAVTASGRFVQCFGIYNGDTAVGFAMIGHHSEDYKGMAEVYRRSYYLWRQAQRSSERLHASVWHFAY